MAKSFNIPKKLEQSPIIYGLLPDYFMVMLILGIVFLMILGLMVLTMASSGSINSAGLLVGVFFLLLTVYAVLYKVLRSKSIYKKYNFKNRVKSISNRDLYEVL